MNNDNLLNLQNLAFNHALYKTSSIEVAEDIASQTIYLYILKKDMVDDQNLNGWIINTCKNYCKQYFERCKKEQDLKRKIKLDITLEFETKINKSLNLTGSEKDELSIAFQEVKESLSSQEFNTLLLYLQFNKNFKSMLAISGESYCSLRQKISRINRKIKAETYKKMGVIATKKIVTPQIDNLIMKFLKSFKQHIEGGSLNKMYRYFSKKDLNNYNPSFNIGKVINYEITLKDSVYTIHVIFKNKENKTDSFYFSFCIDKNHLKIVVPPMKHRTKIMLKLNSADGQKLLELLGKNPENKKGIHNIPENELKIIQQMLMKKKKDE